jgi:tungstate transport system ATP-binding protein
MIPSFILSSVRKCYGNRTALDLDRLALWPGRLYILKGSNGSGKSTLLCILAFLLQPDSGELTYKGERVNYNSNGLDRLRKGVTLLHQSPYLFAGTVFGNVAFGPKVSGIRGEELRRTVSESLDLVGLKGFEERKVGQLSGGESRRVALARSLALKPEVLLLDEPLANVDKDSAQLIERLISALPASGTLVVISTHDPQQEERLKGEVIRLLDGRIAYSSKNTNITGVPQHADL